MGETRVDLLHLLEDLRDAYPGGLEETILTEVVARVVEKGWAADGATVARSTSTLSTAAR
jgi:hypothetical protein